MKTLAQFGNVVNPFKSINNASPLASSNQGSGLIILLNTLLKTAIVIAGVYVLFNIILAGYTFLGAGGDPKKVQAAWEKIYQSVIGLVVVAGSLILAMVFSYLIFGNPLEIISPQIFTPQ